MFNLLSLVQQRNDLVHNIEVNTFDSEGSRKRFVNLSNQMLNILKERREEGQSFDCTLQVKLEGAGGVVQTAETESFVVQVGEQDNNSSKLKIKKPGENSSLSELSDFHCWNMIKLNPTLQKAITEDVDGLFEGLLPMQFEEYLSTVPQ